MKKLLVLILLAFGVLWGQKDADIGFPFGEAGTVPWETGTIAIGELEVYQPIHFEFIDESGLTIVRIDLETGNVTIADGIGMNEASRKFWKMLREIAGRHANCDDFPTTGSTIINHVYDESASTINLLELLVKKK